jgi:hypothetical protein
MHWVSLDQNYSLYPTAVAQQIADQGHARTGDLSGGSPRELIDLPVYRNGIMYNSA